MQIFEFVMQIPGAPAARDRLIQHDPPLHVFDILAEVADGQPLRNRNLAFVGRFLAHDHAEQRSFARPVGAHQPDLLAGIQLKRGVDKHQLFAVLLIDIGKGDQEELRTEGFCCGNLQDTRSGHQRSPHPDVDNKPRRLYLEGMEMIPIKPERKAQLDEYAQRHGQDAVAALDDVLADYLAWERQEYNETVAAVTEAHESVKAGRTQPAGEFLEELRLKHGFSR